VIVIVINLNEPSLHKHYSLKLDSFTALNRHKEGSLENAFRSKTNIKAQNRERGKENFEKTPNEEQNLKVMEIQKEKRREVITRYVAYARRQVILKKAVGIVESQNVEIVKSSGILNKFVATKIIIKPIFYEEENTEHLFYTCQAASKEKTSQVTIEVHYNCF
jgi:hypothetical protein